MEVTVTLEGLTYEISGRGKDGGPKGKTAIFTATFKLDGKVLMNAKKEDLVVHVESPSSSSIKPTIMGGPGGAYHIGFTPDAAGTLGISDYKTVTDTYHMTGQHWFEFVWRGEWANEPLMVPFQDGTKVPDHKYEGIHRKAAGAG